MIKKVEFLVVDKPSTYNVIIGQPFMKKTSMVTTMYYLTIKFPTPMRIKYVKANQTTTQKCHIQSLQLSGEVITKPIKVVVEDVLAIEHRVGEDIILDSLDPKEEYIK